MSDLFDLAADIRELVAENPDQSFPRCSRAVLLQCASALEENKRLREALRSIAANTCCEPCQEAKVVARYTLADEE